MQTSDVTIRLKTLSGTWETCGVDRYPRAVPESVTYSWDATGPNTCAFSLKRDTGDLHPDLSSFTPCEIEIGGQVVWGGFVWETPASSGQDEQIAVAGRGWQYHLDDDMFIPGYIHNDYTQWADARSFDATDLVIMSTAGRVEVGDGAIVIGFNPGTIASGKGAAAVLDLGPDAKNWGRMLTFVVSTVVASGVQLYVRAHPTASMHSGAFVDATPLYGSDANNTAITTVANRAGAPLAYTWSTPMRYVSIMLYYSGTGGAWADPAPAIKVTEPKVYTNTAYEAGGKSFIRSSDVVNDAITRAAPLITPPSYNTPNYEDEILGSTPYAFYKMDEASGSVLTDSSGFGVHGSYGAATAAPTFATSGGVDQQAELVAPTFDGTNDYAQVAALDLSDTRYATFECLFYWTGGAATDELLFEHGTGAVAGSYFDLQVGAGGKPAFQMASASGANSRVYDLSSTTITKNAWHHLVCFVDNGGQWTPAVWLDGVAQALTFRAGSVAGDIGGIGSKPLNLMGRNGGTSLQVAGKLQMFAVYKTAVGRSSRWVADHYAAARAKITNKNSTKTVFPMESYFPREAKTAREVVNAANAMQNRWFTVDPYGQATYNPKPTVPALTTGDWPGTDFEDTSLNSGEEIYNKALVTGTQPDGSALAVTRTLQVWSEAAAPQPSGTGSTSFASNNPDINGVTAAPGPPALAFSGTSTTAGTFTSAPDSLSFTLGTNAVTAPSRLLAQYQDSSTYGGVTPGRRYRASVNLIKPSATPASSWGVLIEFYASDNFTRLNSILASDITANVTAISGTSAVRVRSPEIVAPAGAYFIRATLVATAMAASQTIYWDDLRFEAADGTILDRRGLNRTKQVPVESTITQVTAERIGDLFLAEHQTTPLKGSLSVTKNDGVRSYTNGTPIDTHEIPTYAGQMIAMADRVDPLTGGMGREGRIAEATYTHATRSTSVSIDSQRNNFEAFMARLAIVTG